MSLSVYVRRFVRLLGCLLAVSMASTGVVTASQAAVSESTSAVALERSEASTTPVRGQQLVFPNGRFYVRVTPGLHRRPARILPIRRMSATAIDGFGRRIYWLNRDQRTFDVTLRRVSSAGRHPRILVRRMGLPAILAASRRHVYWDQGGAIGRVAVDGTRIQRHWLEGIRRQASGEILDGLATDRRFLYLSQCFRGRIGRVPLDARPRHRQVEWIVRGIDTCPQDLEVSGDFIYWTGFTRSGAGPGVIGRAPIAGGAPTQVWTNVRAFGGPLSLAVVNGFIYWDWGTSGPRAKDFVGRVRLDGKRFTRKFRRIGPWPIAAVSR
jgi:hypothetical protein